MALILQVDARALVIGAKITVTKSQGGRSSWTVFLLEQIILAAMNIL